MSEGTQKLYVAIGTEYESDVAELARLAQLLQDELLATEVEDVRQADAGALPPDAKAIGAIDWSTLLVTLAGSGSMLTTLAGVFSSWLQRNQGAHLRLKFADGTEVELKGANLDQEQVRRILDEMMRRAAQTGSAAAPPAG